MVACPTSWVVVCRGLIASPARPLLDIVMNRDERSPPRSLREGEKEKREVYTRMKSATKREKASTGVVLVSFLSEVRSGRRTSTDYEGREKKYLTIVGLIGSEPFSKGISTGFFLCRIWSTGLTKFGTVSTRVS